MTFAAVGLGLLLGSAAWIPVALCVRLVRQGGVGRNH